MPASSSSSAIDQVLAHADANLGKSLDRLFDYLRIPSISTCSTAGATFEELGCVS